MLRRTMVLVVCTLAAGGTASAAPLGLFWNDAAGIQGLRLQPEAKPTGLFPTFFTRGLASDPWGRRLLWSDILPLGSPLPGGIVASGMLRDQSVDIVARFLSGPRAVAFDAQHGRVIWSDDGNALTPAGIYSAQLDGSDVRKVLSEPWVSEVAGLAIDPLRDALYFSFQNPLIDSLYTGAIGRVGLDGAGPSVVVAGLAQPVGVAVDPLSRGLFWADAGFEFGGAAGVAADGRIEAADLDGGNRHIILGGLGDPYGVAVDPRAGLVYWSDALAGKIQRTSASGLLPYFEDVVSDLMGLTAISVARLPRMGDANDDDGVGTADYALWAAQYGQAGSLAADFDGSGAVGAADYALWAANVDLPMGASVPEPSGWLLAAWWCALIVAGHRRLTAQRSWCA